jgi:hypothetical protein
MPAAGNAVVKQVNGYYDALPIVLTSLWEKKRQLDSFVYGNAVFPRLSPQSSDDGMPCMA